MNSDRAPEWIAIDIVAQSYGVDIEWLLQAADLGVLHGIEQRGDRLHIAATEMDRIAAAVRWHRHLEVDLETIAILLVQGARAQPSV